MNVKAKRHKTSIKGIIIKAINIFNEVTNTYLMWVTFVVGNVFLIWSVYLTLTPSDFRLFLKVVIMTVVCFGLNRFIR